MTAVLHRKKSKSAQYRFLEERRRWLAEQLGDDAFPSRATCFRRYRTAHRLLEAAVPLQARRAIREGVVAVRHVAADKSLIPAPGAPWHVQDRKAGRRRAGIDAEAAWGYSKHDGWVYGYSYEVVVSATPRSVVFPLAATADVASAAETRTFAAKIPLLPAGVRTVSADSGYDANSLGEAVEFGPDGRRTGRRFLCPRNPRNDNRTKTRPDGPDQARTRHRRLRERRRAYLKSRRGKAVYARRGRTVEPFNEWFKAGFELTKNMWHRGLDNNRTQILASIFAYQLLVRRNHRRGRRNGRIRWMLDAL